jgi:hypothetical protein
MIFGHMDDERMAQEHIYKGSASFELDKDDTIEDPISWLADKNIFLTEDSISKISELIHPWVPERSIFIDLKPELQMTIYNVIYK